MTHDTETLAACWELIDGILVINMDSSPERYQTFMERTGRLLPQEKLHRISAVDGRALDSFGKPPWFTPRTGDRARFWGGTAGCALSHRKGLEFARTQGWKNVLMLEDDAEWLHTPGGAETLLLALQDMQEKDMLYLGFNKPAPWGRLLKRGQGCSLWQVEGVLATHAYAIASGLYDEAIRSLPTEDNVWEWISRFRAIDVYYRDFLSARPGVRICALYPVLLGQGAGVSEISGNAGADAASCQRPPCPLNSAAGLWHRFLYPFRRLKIRLNSIRTHCRASRGGLPGLRKKKKTNRE